MELMRANLDVVAYVVLLPIYPMMRYYVKLTPHSAESTISYWLRTRKLMRLKLDLVNNATFDKIPPLSRKVRSILKEEQSKPLSFLLHSFNHYLARVREEGEPIQTHGYYVQ